MRVPKGWISGKIEDIANVSSGGTPSRKNETYWKGSIPWVATAEINFCTIVDTAEKITELGLKNSSAKIYPANTLLMAMYGQGKTRGKVAVLGIEATTNQACAAIQFNKGYCIDFYYQYLQSKYKDIRELSNSGSQENLNASIVKSIPVPVPPLSEQIKIGKILSTWDKAIAVAEQLLANGQQQKKALMQQLLTSKKRFSKFCEEWYGGYLGDLCSFKGGSAFKEDYQGSFQGDIPFIKVSDMNLLENKKFIHKANNWVNKEDAKAMRAKHFPPGSVVFAKVGAALLLNRRRILVRDTIIDNNMMAALPKLECDTNYLYQLLLLVDFAKFVQEGAVPSINQGDLSRIKVKFPHLEEQQRIASVLTAIDCEVGIFQEQLGCLKQEKKALMQQLLAGKRRVKAEGVSNAF